MRNNELLKKYILIHYIDKMVTEEVKKMGKPPRKTCGFYLNKDYYK
jgi:hypothetical protein